MMKTPLRQRTWHEPRIEDANGDAVATAVSIPEAKNLIMRSNVHDALAKSVEELLPFAARTTAGTADGEPVLARARAVLAEAQKLTKDLNTIS